MYKLGKNGIDEDWYFSLGNGDECLDQTYDFSAWKKLNVPHDWSMDFPYDKEAPSGRRGGFVRTGTGYYKKIIYATQGMLAGYVAVEFEGVYRNSEVYINGKLLGNRPYGYISFSYELTPWLSEGLNILTVKVNDQGKESSRWYNGCGIYRHVWLRITDQLHVAQWGVHIEQKYLVDGRAKLDIGTEMVSGWGQWEEGALTHTIFDSDQKIVGVASDEFGLKPGNKIVAIRVELSHCHLWSLEDPYLYSCHTQVIREGQLIDEVITHFGLRTIDYISNEGFLLNGQNIKFKGVCMHHDAGVVGAAVPDKVNRKRLQLLKDMGCNAVRTAHNPFSPVFYDICDEIGLMVMDEIFDGWEQLKAANDYGDYFEEWHEQDLRDFIKRDRNHPSVVMWSTGNEVTGMTVETNMKLTAIIKSLDGSRPVTCGVNATSQNSEDNRAVQEIAGYNDGGGACFLYDRDHASRPDQLMIATEAPHTSQTRGFYRTQTWWRDKNQARMEVANLTEEEIFFDGELSYRSSYDNAGVRVCIRDSWTLAEERPYLLGEFRWTGFDYYGESFGWPARWSDSGVIGIENCPKDAYYLYQSMWSKAPMVHLLPHWTHPSLAEGTVIPVWVYTNCDEVELFLNGDSLGRRSRGDLKHLQWDVPYNPGRIEVLAFNEGVKVANKAYVTAGMASGLTLSSDTASLIGDGIDTAQIDVRIVDDEGLIVPSGENTLYFDVTDDLVILGTENGNCVDTSPITSPIRKAFNSLAMVLIRSKKLEPDQVAEARLSVASILGTSVFKETTSISIDLCQLSLCGSGKSVYPLKEESSEYRVLVRLNGGQWFDYKGSFEIGSTINVEAKIFKEQACIFTMTSLFTKGERPPVLDRIHGNKVLNLQEPTGPFAKEMAGLWSDGKSTYLLKEEGEFIRKLDGDKEQHLGYWWYDFPVDPFEAGDYAGVGEVWYDSGEKEKLSLVSQSGMEAVLENKGGAIASAYNVPEKFEWKRVRALLVRP